MQRGYSMNNCEIRLQVACKILDYADGTLRNI